MNLKKSQAVLFGTLMSLLIGSIASVVSAQTPSVGMAVSNPWTGTTGNADDLGVRNFGSSAPAKSSPLFLDSLTSYTAASSAPIGSDSADRLGSSPLSASLVAKSMARSTYAERKQQSSYAPTLWQTFTFPNITSNPTTVTPMVIVQFSLGSGAPETWDCQVQDTVTGQIVASNRNTNVHGYYSSGHLLLSSYYADTRKYLITAWCEQDPSMTQYQSYTVIGGTNYNAQNGAMQEQLWSSPSSTTTTLVVVSNDSSPSYPVTLGLFDPVAGTLIQSTTLTGPPQYGSSNASATWNNLPAQTDYVWIEVQGTSITWAQVQNSPNLIPITTAPIF